MSNQTKNSNIKCLIYPTFDKVSRLFVISFRNDDENKTDRFSYSKYLVPKVGIKDRNVLTGDKRFFDTPIKK